MAEAAERVLNKENDRREKVVDKTTSPHASAHQAIFQVFAYCPHCPRDSRGEAGSCFMVDRFDKGDLGDFYYFLTAAHVLYCKDCDGLRQVNIGFGGWQPSLGPTRTILPTPTKDWILEDNNFFGWCAISEEYRKKCENISVTNEELYPHDFGLIAVRKGMVSDFAKTDIPHVVQLLLAKPPLDEFVPEAFVCGYPGQAEKKQVIGDMFWMATKHSKRGTVQAISSINRAAVSAEQRASSSLYSMPQSHMADTDGSKENCTAHPDAVAGLYRYYIDASPGQSGSPVYTVQPGESYSAVAIHAGSWEIPGQANYFCNVAVRLRKEVIKEMLGWIKGNKDKALDQKEQRPVEAIKVKFGKSFFFSSPFEVTEKTSPDVKPPQRDRSLYGEVEDQEKLARDLEAHLNDNQRKNLAREMVRKYKRNLLNKYSVQIKNFAQDPSNGITGYPLDETNLHAIFEWANKENGELTLEEIKEHLENVAAGSKHHFEHILRNVATLEYTDR